jgi:hypothetical protein
MSKLAGSGGVAVRERDHASGKRRASFREIGRAWKDGDTVGKVYSTGWLRAEGA